MYFAKHSCFFLFCFVLFLWYYSNTCFYIIDNSFFLTLNVKYSGKYNFKGRALICFEKAQSWKTLGYTLYRKAMRIRIKRLYISGRDNNLLCKYVVICKRKAGKSIRWLAICVDKRRHMQENILEKAVSGRLWLLCLRKWFYRKLLCYEKTWFSQKVQQLSHGGERTDTGICWKRSDNTYCLTATLFPYFCLFNSD